MIFSPIHINQSASLFMPPDLLISDSAIAKNESDPIVIYINIFSYYEDMSEVLRARLDNNLPTKVIIDASWETLDINSINEMHKHIPELKRVNESDILLLHNVSDILCGIPISSPYQTHALDYYLLDTYYKCLIRGHPFDSTKVNERKNGLNLLIGKLKTRFARFLTSYYFYKHDLLKDAVLGINAYPDDIQGMMNNHPEYNDIDYYNTILKYLGPADHTRITDSNEGISSSTGWPFDPNIFKNSSVSYICETFDVDRSSYPYLMTEKIYRSIVNNHPFIIQAGSGQLDLVKSFGFKTFNEFIDESYNTYENRDYSHVEKTILVAKELVAKIPDNADKIQEIVDYNFNHFCSLGKTGIDEFHTVIKNFTQSV